MSTMDSYGVVGDGGGGLQNNNNNQSPELMPNMRLAFSAANGAAVYKPVMPPTSPHSASATPTPSYQPGGNGGAITAFPLSINVSAGEQTKRKRGRPKKNNLDVTSPPPLQQHHPAEVGLQQPSGFLSPAPVAVSPPGKKQRGRPPGSGRKQPVAAMGSPEAGFTPHVITVKAGEDVSSKIMSVSQSGTQAICILSANGAISNVTLRQAATSGGTVTYEGRFEILSLSGSFMLIECGGQRSRTGGLSVMLAGPDGRVLGGGVAGVLTAAAPVQVVVGCFNADQELKSPNQADLLAAPPKFIPGASSGGSPASRGTLSESSGGPGSPLNQSGGIYNNNNLQGMTSFTWK